MQSDPLATVLAKYGQKDAERLRRWLNRLLGKGESQK
jgi:hypothetical protein